MAAQKTLTGTNWRKDYAKLLTMSEEELKALPKHLRLTALRAVRKHSACRSAPHWAVGMSPHALTQKDARKKRPMNGEYEAYIKSKEWKAIRVAAIEQAGNRCSRCGFTPKSLRQLHVHHLTYERFGHETLDDVAVLCRECHAMLHKARTNP